MPTISVIVPVYKVEEYLPRCLDSILAQTFTDFELILVDDGSPDNCGKICDEYAEKDKRIKVIHQENARLSAARNAGMDLAQGVWIALVDSDDWLHPDYLNILISGALEDTDLVICDCLVTSNDEEENLDYSQTVFRSVSLDEVQANHIARTRAWGRIYRKSSVGDLRFISGAEPAEDACFNELFYSQDMKLRITDAKLYYYYMRPDSAIHSHFGRGTFNSIGPLLERLDKIEDSEKRKRIIKRCYKYVLSARYGELFTEDYPDVLRECKQLFKQLHPYLRELERKDRMLYQILCTFPSLYRAWRIHDDPSLLSFEREKKRRFRTQLDNS